MARIFPYSSIVKKWKEIEKLLEQGDHQVFITKNGVLVAKIDLLGELIEKKTEQFPEQTKQFPEQTKQLPDNLEQLDKRQKQLDKRQKFNAPVYTLEQYEKDRAVAKEKWEKKHPDIAFDEEIWRSGLS